jgi:ATP-dependent Clp protease ATP-binding subunit ClpB
LQLFGIILFSSSSTFRIPFTARLDPVYGARPLKRAIQSEIENPLAKEILSGRFAAKETIVVDAADGRIVFRKQT